MQCDLRCVGLPKLDLNLNGVQVCYRAVFNAILWPFCRETMTQNSPRQEKRYTTLWHMHVHQLHAGLVPSIHPKVEAYDQSCCWAPLRHWQKRSNWGKKNKEKVNYFALGKIWTCHKEWSIHLVTQSECPNSLWQTCPVDFSWINRVLLLDPEARNVPFSLRQQHSTLPVCPVIFRIAPDSNSQRINVLSIEPERISVESLEKQQHKTASWWPSKTSS